MCVCLLTARVLSSGAGKSTTSQCLCLCLCLGPFLTRTAVNMLTGLLAPSSGTALLRGQDITQDMTSIRWVACALALSLTRTLDHRQQLGVCPQHDILFPSLTVLEHLRLFAKLKVVSSVLCVCAGIHNLTHAPFWTCSGRGGQPHSSGGAGRAERRAARGTGRPAHRSANAASALALLLGGAFGLL